MGFVNIQKIYLIYVYIYLTLQNISETRVFSTDEFLSNTRLCERFFL